MADRFVPNFCSSYGYVSTVAATTSVDIPAVQAPNDLPILDWICASIIASAASTFVLSVETRTLALKSLAAAGTDHIHLTFPGGLPLWGNPDAEIGPMILPTLTCSGSTATTCTMHYGYHFENSAGRRTR